MWRRTTSTALVPRSAVQRLTGQAAHQMLPAPTGRAYDLAFVCPGRLLDGCTSLTAKLAPLLEEVQYGSKIAARSKDAKE
jgi:hypothetical protein